MYDRVQLNKINNIISENPEKLFQKLNLDFEIKNSKVNSNCSIHCGDNEHALTIYLDGYKQKGRYICRSRRCHEIFTSTMIGFCRGVLSNREMLWRSKGDKVFPFMDTLRFIESIYNINNLGKTLPEEEERFRWVNSTLSREYNQQQIICSRDDYLRWFTKPPEYFFKRGFSHEVLEKFDVRYYHLPNGRFNNRCVCPVYDQKNIQLITGICGRSANGALPRWMHTDNFPAATTFYGLWFAEKFIRESRSVTLVEGPCDVWRLHEAGVYNSLGTFGGAGLSPTKHLLLDKMGVMNINLAFDNDEAGRVQSERVIKEYGRFYNIRQVILPNDVKDIGDLSVDRIKELKLK